MTIQSTHPPASPPQVGGWLALASPEVDCCWRSVQRAIATDPPSMGLSAGDRPAADVEVLAGTVASCEYLLAARMHAASTAGCLLLASPGGVLAARGCSIRRACRMARCGALAAEHASISAAWAGGVIASEHVDPIARAADRFTPEELAALIGELDPHWGSWSPASIARFVQAADRLLHPSPDPTPDEADAYERRNLSFALTADSVLIGGELPRLEGELVIVAIDAFAERLRSEADHVPADSRRADALVALVNNAYAADVLPSRGGLPVGLTVTLDHTALGDPLWSTSRGHLLTQGEARWAACDAAITPILVSGPGGEAPSPISQSHPPLGAPTSAARVAALAAAMFAAPAVLDVGRTQRTATASQRRALAARDRGCIIPGCGIPAEACQTHHITSGRQAAKRRSAI